MMSVAFELEYEVFRPTLRLVSDRPVRAARPVQVQRRRLILAFAVAVLLILLMLPIRAFGGSTLAGQAPAQGQEYIVKSGDTLASIARQADPSNVSGMIARLEQVTGSDVVVAGEHVQIP
jgi:hypothetical protein